MATGLVTVTRWRRYGHDRLYVTDQDGIQLGYRDLETGADHPSRPQAGNEVRAAADAWAATAPSSGGPSGGPPPQAPSGRTPTAAPSKLEQPWTDLALNRAGAAVRERALDERSAAPVRTTLARVLGVHTDERAWRIGADGEELVAKQLAKLTKRVPAWTAIHSIPVGRSGSDIDHLVIGPGGVFTVNDKCHPDKDIWVGGNTFLVDGQRTAYVRNARHEAQRASRLLSEVTGTPVHVEGLIVPVLSNRPVVKSQPGDGVHVVARSALSNWLLGLGPIVSPDRLAVIWEVARRSTTWVV